MIISPCVLLVPAAADKESMSHPHKHKLTQHMHARTHTYTHTQSRVYSRNTVCYLHVLTTVIDCVNRKKKVYFPATLYFMEISTLLPRSGGGNM